MGLFHVATVAPSKLEMVAGWIPTQPWGPSTDAVVEMIGAFRFDDPLGQVGRWHIAPTNVRLSGGGWSIERVPVDGFDVFEDHSERVVLRNDRFSMTAFRRPVVVLGGPW